MAEHVVTRGLSAAPPAWALRMMREYGVSGWNKGHPIWQFRNGDVKCLACGTKNPLKDSGCRGGRS